MKNKLLKIGMVSVITLIGSSLGIAKADDSNTTKNCIHHKDYFFFNQINKVSTLLNNKTLCPGDPSSLGSCTGTMSTKGGSYFPNINKVTKEEIKKSGLVCLKKGELVEGDNCSTNGTWTLEEFYTNWKKAASQSFERLDSVKNEFVSAATKGPDSNSFTYKIATETAEDGTVINYILHGKWYTSNDDDSVNWEEVAGNGEDYQNVSTDKLVSGSFFPGKTPTIDDPFISDIRYIKPVVHRTYTGEAMKNSNITPFKYQWTGSNKTDEPVDSVLSPALYYIEYDICEDVPNEPEPDYNSDITYKCVDENGEEMECPGGDPDPDHREELEDGYTHDVDSPKIEGCTPDQETVKIKIEGKDFKEEVIYTCKAPKNPGTGSFLIVIAWLVGLGSLGYSGYYFYKLKKSKTV